MCPLNGFHKAYVVVYITLYLIFLTPLECASTMVTHSKYPITMTASNFISPDPLLYWNFQNVFQKT